MSRYRKTMREALEEIRGKVKEQQNLKEDGHTDVVSAKRQCSTIMEDARDISNKLGSLSPEDGLPSWWMNKLAVSSNSMNKLRDFFIHSEERLPRQLKDPKKEMMVVKDGKVKVIDKSDWDKYKAKGYDMAEELEEGKMKDIFSMQQDGASVKDIAKKMGLDVQTVKDILGEEIALEKVERVPTGQYIVSYKTQDGTRKARVFDYRQHAHDFEKKLKSYGLKSEEDLKEDKDAEIESLKKEIAMLKQKAETEKAKTHKNETEKLVNPDTGEPLLQVGIAYKHLRDKEAKEKAAEVRLKRKDKEDKEKAVKKFRDRIKESANLNESEASDQAKTLGLDYMQFGRYGKNGKVTHMSKDGQLVKVSGDKDVDTKSSDGGKSQGGNDGDDNTKSEPKPVVDKFDAQKDLEDMVTDGMIDVDDDGEGGLTATKEYEPSQDYEAEKDVENITQYFKDKGVDEKDIYVDVDSKEDYISVSVEVRGKGKVKTEEIELDEMTFNKAMVDKLKKAYEPLRGKRIAPEPLMKIFDKIDSNKDALITLYKADIPFVSTLAGSRLSQKHNLSPMDIKRIISKEEVQESVKFKYALVDTSKDNEVLSLSSDEKDLKMSVHHRNRGFLKIVKLKKPTTNDSMIGYSLKEEVELTEYFATVHSKRPEIAKFINANKKGIDYVDVDAGSNIEFEGKGAHELADKVKAKFGVKVTKEDYKPLSETLPSMTKPMTVQYTYTRNPDLFDKTLAGTKTGKKMKNVGPKLKGVYVLKAPGQDHINFLQTLNSKGIMPKNKILGEEQKFEGARNLVNKILGERK